MIPKLQHYEKVVGKEEIRKLREAAEPLRGKHVDHVNSTSSGGGVAEMLNTLVFLMNDLDITTGWRTIIGSNSFFKITKGIHNALQGAEWRMSSNRQALYREYCERNAIINHIGRRDFVVVHDPQPLGMIEHYPERTGPWFWRCHIDVSQPNKETVDFLGDAIKQYNGIILSHDDFRLKNTNVPQTTIYPSIDPLSRKNEHMTSARARRLFKRKGLDLTKPFLLQVSRFDPWKGQEGVIRMYERIREMVDCELVLMGDMASDDPQGPVMFHKVAKMAERVPGIHLITEKNDLLVNALQREAAIVFQNSTREGFGLTVSESLWKKTPVLGTNVGGIPLQVRNGRSGYIINSVREGVEKAVKLLKDDGLRKRMGERGHEDVKRRFLITRHLRDYVELFKRAERERLKGGST